MRRGARSTAIGSAGSIRCDPQPVSADRRLDLKQLALDSPDWRCFVGGRAEATPFHDPGWAALLAEVYGFSGSVLAQLDAGGAISAGIPVLAAPRLPGRPRRLVSLPFTDVLEPLVDPADAASLAATLDAARDELGADRIELHGDLAGARHGPSQAVIHTLALQPDPDLIFAALSKGKRRDVRAAERNDLVLRRAEEKRELTETYFGLHLQTRRRLGVPSQPKRFFELLWERVIAPGGGFVLIVHEGRFPVAGAVFLTGNGTVVYKYSASDSRRRGQLPNTLLVWAAIRDACEQGFRRFDFGRSELEAAGLRHFKAGWGAVEEPLVYSAIGGGDDGSSDAATPGIVGRVLRRSPTWVTRATGELLYRFAA